MIFASTYGDIVQLRDGSIPFATYPNSCVPRALYAVSNNSYADILLVCVKYGYDSRGMIHYMWLKATEELGIKLERIPISCKETPCGYFTKGTISKHCKTTMQTGTYIVCTRGHALVVEDGQIFGTFDQSHPYKDVRTIYRVIY